MSFISGQRKQLKVDVTITIIRSWPERLKEWSQFETLQQFERDPLSIHSEGLWYELFESGQEYDVISWADKVSGYYNQGY